MDGPPAMTLGIEPARPGIMHDKPRRQSAQILTLHRLARLILYGVTMMIGTLLIYRHALATQSPAYALTLAFTTFVLFQFFNVFNARAEYGRTFNANIFRNGKLWVALASVLALQAVVVHWLPAQALFGTTDLQLKAWLLSAATASSVLLLDEARKALQHYW